MPGKNVATRKGMTARGWTVTGLGFVLAAASVAVPATEGLVLAGCSLGLFFATAVLGRRG